MKKSIGKILSAMLEDTITTANVGDPSNYIGTRTDIKVGAVQRRKPAAISPEKVKATKSVLPTKKKTIKIAKKVVKKTKNSKPTLADIKAKVARKKGKIV